MKESTVFSRCANPDCAASFDHRHGRFFRFHRPRLKGGPAANTHSVWHFWLCKACYEAYTLEYSEGRGVLLRRRIALLPKDCWPRLIAAAGT